MVLVYGIWLQGGKRFHLPNRAEGTHKTLCGVRYTSNEEGFWEFKSLEVLVRDFLCLNACKYGKADHGEVCLPFNRAAETTNIVRDIHGNIEKFDGGIIRWITENQGYGGGWIPIPRFTVRKP